MIKFLKRLLSKEKGEINHLQQLDYTNSFGYSDVFNKNKLLIELIKNVPVNTIWSIEGIENNDVYEFLIQFETKDNITIERATIWPKQKMIKVRLTEEAKYLILQKLPSWNLDQDIIHQHLYLTKEPLFTSFDNLNEGSTWISTKLNNLINKLEGVVELENDNYH